MQKLASKFIAATAEIYRLETQSDPDCKLFRKVMEQGYTQGMPRGSSQGFYTITPSGVLLDRINVGEGWRHGGGAAGLVKMLESALAKWETLPRSERLQPNDPRKESAAIHRNERFYPKDGLVLHEYSRDLPRDPPQEDERANAWGQDFAWFTRAEGRQFLPPRPRVGQKQQVPAPLIQRLASIHLVDHVRGNTSPFLEEHIEKARLTVEVTAVKGTVVSLRLEGETRANRNDGSSGDERITAPQKRGLETRLFGKATYDGSKERFLTFELVAVGTRWGARDTDMGPAPIGFLLTLAGDSPVERIAPRYFGKYGWGK